MITVTPATQLCHSPKAEADLRKKLTCIFCFLADLQKGDIAFDGVAKDLLVGTCRQHWVSFAAPAPMKGRHSDTSW